MLQNKLKNLDLVVAAHVLVGVLVNPGLVVEVPQGLEGVIAHQDSVVVHQEMNQEWISNLVLIRADLDLEDLMVFYPALIQLNKGLEETQVLVEDSQDLEEVNQDLEVEVHQDLVVEVNRD